MGGFLTAGLCSVLQSLIDGADERWLSFSLLFNERAKEAPTVMSVEMDYFNWNASYPAIILCPRNKADEESLSTLVNDTLERTGHNVDSYLSTILSASLETLEHLQVPQPEILSLIHPGEYARICFELFKRFDNSTLTTITNWPMTVEASMTEMGICHIINSNVAVFDNPSKWSDSGVTYAKNNIQLSFHDRDFFVQLMNYADEYEIYIISPDDVILSGSPSSKFDTEGFLSFGVQISSTRASQDLRFMSLHLRKCRFIEESNSNRYPVYSYNRCMLECRIKMILKLCGCVPHFYKPLDHEKICDLAELRCVLFYKREIMSLSALNETLDKFEDTNDIPRISRDCGCLGDCEADVYLKDHEIFLPQETINRLKISVSTFPKVRVVREIIFGFYDIILRSGGVVNLCIGTSVISIMELLLTAIRIPIYEIAQMVQECQKPNSAPPKKGKSITKMRNKKIKIK